MSITRSNTRTVSPEDIDVCARVTGDLGEHHMGGLDGRRMAQGVLTLSAVPLLAEPGVHMRELSFTFLAPVYAGDTITATVQATRLADPDPSVDPLPFTCEVSVVNAAGDPVLAGTGLAELPRSLAAALSDGSAGEGN